MSDRRHLPRQDVTLSGTIQMPLRAGIPVTISNISSNGALLHVGRYEHLPRSFKLVVGDFETSCTVVHRARGAYGVSFENSYGMAAEMAHIYATWSGPTAAQRRQH
jgi:hypothetical protein